MCRFCADCELESMQFWFDRVDVHHVIGSESLTDQFCCLIAVLKGYKIPFRPCTGCTNVFLSQGLSIQHRSSRPHRPSSLRGSFDGYIINPCMVSNHLIPPLLPNSKQRVPTELFPIPLPTLSLHLQLPFARNESIHIQAHPRNPIIRMG